jgi:hypothetical protein
MIHSKGLLEEDAKLDLCGRIFRSLQKQYALSSMERGENTK